jgi:uncharacterized protein (TIGR03437 family)
MKRTSNFQTQLSRIGRFRWLIRRAARCALGAALLSAAAWAGTLGTVVPIGGNASDLVLDEARGVLYIANFTANRIEIMTMSDLTIHKSINVNPQPGAMAISPDGRFLVVTHFGNFDTTVNLPAQNALSVIDLGSNSIQAFSLGFPPLGVAFGNDGRALVLTTNDFLLFDPLSGAIQVLDTVASVVAKTLPVAASTFPPDITTGSLAASGDGFFIYGINDKIQFRYDVQNKVLSGFGYTSSPPEGPRVATVNKNGSIAIGGWTVNDFRRNVNYDFPNPSGALSVGTHVIDSTANVIYAQIPPPNPPPPAAGSSTTCLPDGRCITVTNAPATAGTTQTFPPTLEAVDADNLTIREQFQLGENLGGRSVLNAAADTMYSISDSGVTVFPVGARLKTVHRLAASKETVVFQGNGCAKGTATQQITITDPGGGATDFALTAQGSGVLISPSIGVTPATVTISYDPVAFQNQKGTTTIPVRLTSLLGVNPAQTFNVLINNHDTDQRGSVVNVAGKLTDVISDNGHDRYYVLRQDKNQILVYAGGTNTQIATLRTGAVPTQMAISTDNKWLLVGHDASQYIAVFDLDTLLPDLPVQMPPGHYPRSVAVSNQAILAASRVAGPIHMISRVDLVRRVASAPATLGIFKNDINIDTVLTSSPSGASIVGMMPDGTVMLYSAGPDAFTISRKGPNPLSGAYAASDFGPVVIGNAVLNSSLAPTGTQLGTGSGSGAGISAGFAFFDQLGYRTSSTSAAGPGIVQKIDFSLNTGFRPTRMVESPIFTTPSTAPATTVGVAPAPTVNQPGIYVSAFSRTLAPLINRATLISLTQSGFTILPTTYDSPAPIPQIGSVVNAADQTKPVAPGGLISVLGSGLSPTNLATTQIPMPTALGESCLSVNGVAIPLLFVSDTQINAQLPFNIEGSSQMVLRTPGGVSDNLNFTILPTAPSVFRSSGGATVVRAANNAVVSDNNPVLAGDELVIYATGLGRTSPAVDTGAAAPSSPLAAAMTQPSVTLSGLPLRVDYAGLTPGGVGVYQINVRVPGSLAAGSNLPMTIQQGGSSTTVNLQVADQ